MPEVTPGEPFRCQLKIYNPSEAVNEFTVVGLHDAAGWVSTEPATLTLLPETDGEFTVTVLIPADAPVEAGKRTVHLLVRSALDEFEAKAETLDLEVAPVSRWNLELEPSTERSKRAGSYELRLANEGNHPLSVELIATASSNALNIRLAPATLEVPPFRTATATLKITAPRYTGRDDLHHHVDVQARTDEGAPRSRRATFVQKPRLSRWKLLLLVLAIIAALVVGILVAREWWGGQVLLARGDTGRDVGQWQVWLNATGHSLAVDGRFGSRTERATRNFQQRVGLPVTGAVERRTWNAMERRFSAAPSRAPAVPPPRPVASTGRTARTTTVLADDRARTDSMWQHNHGWTSTAPTAEGPRSTNAPLSLFEAIAVTISRSNSTFRDALRIRVSPAIARPVEL